eukprot:m.99117 g.99117  ORF g.99117 m.99117 type:complete len:482 (-) comp20599_c0_seq1:243-1688(-)
MEGGTSTCSDAGKISRRPVAWIYPSQCDVVGPTRCPLPTNSGSIGGAVGDALTALAMSPGSEVDVASTASASDDPFEAPVTPASLTPVIGLSIGSLTLVETQQPTVSGQVEVTCSPATDGSIATHTYDLASSNEDIAVPCAAASRHRTDSVHVYDDPFEGLSDNEDAEVLAWWVAAQVHLSKTEGTRVTVGGDGGVVEPDRELGESPPDNPIAELDTADWFHGRVPVEVVHRILREDGHVGAFLLRQSSQDPTNRLALSFVAQHDVAVWNNDVPRHTIPVHHVSIPSHKPGGWIFAHEIFASSQALLHHLLARPTMRAPDGTQIRLEYPIGRPDRASTKKIEDPWQMSAALLSMLTASALDGPISRVDPSGVCFNGYLTKQGHIRKNWKLRWFELQGPTLSYFKKAGDSIPKGMIDLRLATSISRADRILGRSGTNGKPYSLKLVLSRGDAIRVWFMYAATEDQIDEWIDHIRSVMGPTEA